MYYSILIQKRGGDPIWYEDNLLPGIIPQKLIDHTRDFFVENLGICKTCKGTLCHVIDERGQKYCPVLFHDLVKPQNWKLTDVL